ncbi:MAG TPA: ABC transporter substrate-binding protein, partial [Pirellulaceae bacterium]|nr:ABC transporter substrate-binding protein [Pirellulaceae bacterium]
MPVPSARSGSACQFVDTIANFVHKRRPRNPGDRHERKNRDPPRRLFPMIRHITRATLLAAVAAVALGAASPAGAQEFRYGSANDILGLDPHANNHGVTNAMKSNMYEPLVRRRFDGSLEPGLAVRWENTTPTTWKFELRKGVKFHDGEPFTADDVVASFERVRQASSDMNYTVVSI